MAFGASPDPVPATHQLLALLEFEELEPFDRSLLEWLRQRLSATRAAPSAAAWLAWYREVLSGIRQLSARWQAQKSEASSQGVIAIGTAPNAAAVSRVKESAQGFVHRWGVRLQDQSNVLKDQLQDDARRVHVLETTSETHITFGVPNADLEAFSQYMTARLNAWSTDVESKLPPSWLEHIRDAVHAEGLPSGLAAPPTWPVPRLSVSALAAPRLEPHSTRRPTLFKEFLRVARSAGGCITQIVSGTAAAGGIIILVASELNGGTDKAKLGGGLMAGTGAFILLLLAPIFFVAAKRSFDDELAQLRSDQAQRIHGALESWVASSVEAHRTRIQSLVGASATEARSRLAEWADVAWPSKPGSSPMRTPSKGFDYGPWLMTLGSARSSIAARVAQLELDNPASQRGEAPQ